MRLVSSGYSVAERQIKRVMEYIREAPGGLERSLPIFKSLSGCNIWWWMFNPGMLVGEGQYPNESFPRECPYFLPEGGMLLLVS